MSPREPRPRPNCWRCDDWGTLVPPGGGPPQPCPEQCAASRKTQTQPR